MSEDVAVPGEGTRDARGTRAAIEALRDEHGWIMSCDSCCHCGDGECDGVGCIACLDPDDERDHDALNALHDLLREGQAWRALRAMVDGGADLLTAYMLAEEALENANNRTRLERCEVCHEEFLAVTPCDVVCIPCRVDSIPPAASRDGGS